MKVIFCTLMIHNASSIRLLSEDKLVPSTLHNKNATTSLSDRIHIDEPRKSDITQETMVVLFILFLLILLVIAVILDCKKNKEK